MAMIQISRLIELQDENLSQISQLASNFSQMKTVRRGKTLSTRPKMRTNFRQPKETSQPSSHWPVMPLTQICSPNGRKKGQVSQFSQYASY
jgi:hypothetical protein